MNTKMVIVVVLTAAVLTRILSSITIAVYAEGDLDGDSSETETEVKIKEEATASGQSIADNCGYIKFNIEDAETFCVDFTGYK